MAEREDRGRKGEPRELRIAPKSNFWLLLCRAFPQRGDGDKLSPI